MKLFLAVITAAMLILGMVWIGSFFDDATTARANADRAMALAQIENSKTAQAAINSQTNLAATIIGGVILALVVTGAIVIIYKSEANKHDRIIDQWKREYDSQPRTIEAHYYYIEGKPERITTEGIHEGQTFAIESSHDRRRRLQTAEFEAWKERRGNGMA